jgi:hypothetical protein
VGLEELAGAGSRWLRWKKVFANGVFDVVFVHSDDDRLDIIA